MPYASVEFCAWIVLSHEYNLHTVSRPAQLPARSDARRWQEAAVCQLATLRSYDM